MDWRLALELACVLALWVLWEVGRAIRGTLRPPILRELERVRVKLERVQNAFDGIDAHIKKPSGGKFESEELEEGEELH